MCNRILFILMVYSVTSLYVWISIYVCQNVMVSKVNGTDSLTLCPPLRVWAVRTAWGMQSRIMCNRNFIHFEGV